MSLGVNLQEFVAGFILEADEHLHSVNRNLVSVADALKTDRLEPRAVRELFRSLHTIKGLASMVGATPIVDVSHEMEGILRTADRAGGQMSEAALDLLLKGTRVIEERIKLIPKLGVGSLPKAPPSLVQDLIQFQNAEGPKPAARAAADFELPAEVLRSLSLGDKEQALQGVAANRKLLLVDFEPSKENAAAGLNITSVRERLGKVSELVKVSPHASLEAPTGIAFYLLILTDNEIAGVAEAVGIPQSAVRSVTVNNSEIKTAVLLPDDFQDEMLNLEDSPIERESSSVRVDIKKLDEVLERLSDLIVTRSKLAKISSKLTASGVDTRELLAVISENGRQLKRLRTAVTQSRMVSVTELFQRLPLVVRGLTNDANKSVDIFVQAGSAEVDKAVADKIFPAIVHLVRNSVDHALENKNVRKASGKDETGVITVECDDAAGATLSIKIKDDGRGIDREAVAKKSGQAVAKTDEELLKQICAPGLSTKEGVTTTSGRGMGMDIVKRTIEMLGGKLILKTEKNVGTTFEISVPVSITIVDVLSFVSGGQIFVSPIAMIEEILEVDPELLPLSPSLVKTGPQPRLLNRRGETIPFLNLESILNNFSDRSHATKALIVNQPGGAMAFGVDRMIGQQEVVIRALDESILQVRGITGAADLGDGFPTLVIDLANIASEFSLKVEVH